MEQRESFPKTARKYVHAIDEVDSGLSTTTDIGGYVAIDRESVGVGPNDNKGRNRTGAPEFSLLREDAFRTQSCMCTGAKVSVFMCRGASYAFWMSS